MRGGIKRDRVRDWWGASTLPFTDCPSGGASSKLEVGEGGDSPAFGSKEGVVAIFSLGCERGSSSSKRRGEVHGSGDSELEAGVGGDLAFQQVKSSSHPISKTVPRTQTQQSALMMCNASRMNPFGKGVSTTSMSSKLL